MKDRRLYDIVIINLSHKEHDFSFEINDIFFESFDDSLISKGKLKADIRLNKSETLIQATFKVEGTVELTCDRSLENFDYPISANHTILFKYGEAFEELSEEIIIIPRDLSALNVAQYIYEYIGLSIPIKKLHPKFIIENEEDTEEEHILIYSTKGSEDLSSEEDDKVDETESDPRWNLLKNIRNNFN